MGAHGFGDSRFRVPGWHTIRVHGLGFRVGYHRSYYRGYCKGYLKGSERDMAISIRVTVRVTSRNNLRVRGLGVLGFWVEGFLRSRVGSSLPV